MALMSERVRSAGGSQGWRLPGAQQRIRVGLSLLTLRGSPCTPRTLIRYPCATRPTPLCHEADDVRRDPSGGAGERVCRSGWMSSARLKPSQQGAMEMPGCGRAGLRSGKKSLDWGREAGCIVHRGQGQGFRTSLEGTTKLFCFKFKSSQIPNN